MSYPTKTNTTILTDCSLKHVFAQALDQCWKQQDSIITVVHNLIGTLHDQGIRREVIESAIQFWYDMPK